MSKITFCGRTEHRLYNVLGTPCPCIEAIIKSILQGTTPSKMDLKTLYRGLMLANNNKARELLLPVLASSGANAYEVALYLSQYPDLYEHILGYPVIPSSANSAMVTKK